jgi:hypothetical protein
LWVQAQDAVQAVQRDHDAVFDRQRAAAEAGAAAARDERHAEAMAGFHCRDDLFLRDGDHYSEGALLEGG